MRTSFDVRSGITAELREAGWRVARDAMDPLKRIDFSKLVDILDHEERFLERAFMSALIGLRTARVSTPSDRGKITAEDVETALRMLGTAVALQAKETLTEDSKRLIIDSCGFC